ncbi:MAG: 4a-hydroxytetrahydrobiopterin dehydratase [Mariprofundus sp.]
MIAKGAAGLQYKKCIPCQGGMTPMSLSAATTLLAEIPGWELLGHGRKIRRTFTFSDFMQAQAFAMQVGHVAEEENHHPDISYGWGYCTVVLFTHKIGGLHENDFILAAKVNDLDSVLSSKC